MEEGKGSEIARSCWREMRKRAKEGRVGSKWKRERLRKLRLKEKKERNDLERY